MIDGFDPFAYVKDAKAHPENYISLAQIVEDAKMLRRIRHASDMKTLKDAFHGPAKAAKAAGDTMLLTWLTEAKDKRKKELERG